MNTKLIIFISTFWLAHISNMLMSMNQSTHTLTLFHCIEKHRTSSHIIEAIKIEEDFCRLTITADEIALFKKEPFDIIVETKNLDSIYKNLNTMYEADKNSTKELCIRCKPTSEKQLSILLNADADSIKRIVNTQKPKPIAFEPIYLDESDSSSIDDFELFYEQMQNNSQQPEPKPIAFEPMYLDESDSSSIDDFEIFCEKNNSQQPHSSVNDQGSYLTSAADWIAEGNRWKPSAISIASAVFFVASGATKPSSALHGRILVTIARVSACTFLASPVLGMFGTYWSGAKKNNPLPNGR